VAHNSVTVRVPAKVNLQLSVGPREADGFHNLVSVFQAISIFDDVTVTKSNPGSGVTISVTGEHTHGVPEDHSNLAVKAAQLIGEKSILKLRNRFRLQGEWQAEALMLQALWLPWMHSFN
jgi:4-diphosphocytidyl-2-C-methyl-D-erythritol kinase